MNGKAGTPTVPVRDESGIIRGHMLRGDGWRLVYPPCGEILLAASAGHPALAYFPATASDEDQS
jgi:hypothetical protein